MALASGQDPSRVEVQTDGPADQATHADANGQFRLDALPVGPYLVCLSWNGHHEAFPQITVESGKEVQFPPIELAEADRLASEPGMTY